MNALQESILAGIRKRLRQLLKMERPSARENLSLCWEIDDAKKHNAVRIEFWRWMGTEPTGAERRAAHRALVALEAAGLVKRVRLAIADFGGDRATHVKLIEGST